MKPERLFDILFSIVLIVFLAPVIFISLCVSAVFIGFPPLYGSTRVGKHGKLYRHIKIKTMLPGKELGRSYFESHRLNTTGKILRRYHLDELPELFLILSGITSFVGPRPLMPQFLKKFNTGARETVVPGWTCLAQIKLLRRGILPGPEQIRLDAIYAKKKSLLYNVKIMAATIQSFLQRKPPVDDLGYNRYRKEFHGAE
ncbi:MAG: sugar transferase [Spirochaetales bacterium]|nr:sugar transferase [Spirochaetales bacterium]